jgi:hypothetical protein
MFLSGTLTVNKDKCGAPFANQDKLTSQINSVK